MTPKYGMFELSFHGPSEGNPFVDVDFRAEFHYRNLTQTVPGFYDGDGIYRIRFMPQIEGQWRYVTHANVPELDSQSGSLICGPAAEGSHGPIRVKDTFHFAHDDDTPFYPVGTTAYAWTSQEPEVVQMTLDTLKTAPFNKIRMSPFPKHFMYNFNEPPLYPFEGGPKPGVVIRPETLSMFMSGPSDFYEFDFDRPNTVFWRYFENLVAKIGEMGIQCDLILFHPYDRWGFSTMPKEANLRYLRYVVARLAAYPNIWWSFANEWDVFPGRTVEDWEDYAAEVVQWDHVQHLRGIHNCNKMYDQSKAWITHVSFQRIDYYSHVELTAKMREQYRKPIVFDEIVYEGDIDAGFGNISGEELTRRFWEVAIRGGYATHGETYYREDQLLWWAKGGELTGTSPARIGFLREILESCPGYIDPRNNTPMDLALPCGLSGTHYLRQSNTIMGPMQMEYAQCMICYFGIQRPRFMDFTLPEDIRYQVDVIDTWNMTIDTMPGEHSGSVRVDMPGREYIAVRFRAVT